MGVIVVPFRGTNGKRRLTEISGEAHDRVVLAMLADVLAATTAVARTVVVTSDPGGLRLARAAGAEVVADPGGGQGAAVAAALDTLPADETLVVNADVPCVAPDDLRALGAATPAGGIALVPSPDGRTNALGLATPPLFRPLYGPESAARFRAAAQELGVASTVAAIPNLEHDVDTRADLDRIQARAGRHTQSVLDELQVLR